MEPDLIKAKWAIAMFFAIVAYFLFRTLESGMKCYCDNRQDFSLIDNHKKFRRLFLVTLVFSGIFSGVVLYIHLVNTWLFKIHIGVFVIPFVVTLLLQFFLEKPEGGKIRHYVIGYLCALFFCGSIITGGLLLMRG